MDVRERYWTQFDNYLTSRGSTLRTGKPNSKNWIKVRHQDRFKRSGAHLAATAIDRPRAIAAFVVLEDDDSLALLDDLLDRRREIERDVGHSLTWERKPTNKRVRRIFVQRYASFRDERDWEAQFAWLANRLERLHSVFHPLIA